jgi:hypothetical protein
MTDKDKQAPVTPNQDPEKAPEKNKVPAGDPPRKPPAVIDPERRSGAV